MRFATTIRSFEQDARGVRALLSDGSTVTADLLVGADGVRSHIRELAFGKEARLSRFLNCSTAAFIFRNPPPTLRSSDALCTLTVPSRQVATYPVRDGGVATFFVHTAASQLANVSPTTATQELHRVYGGMGWIIPELLKHMDPVELYFDAVLQIETPRWSTRRVVLIGDACYCVSLLAGQGASLAMAGA
jgi:2-polyprenyl-6-methoxyphenol hydroxylase-like FAD-dependent oxidoreductase